MLVNMSFVDRFSRSTGKYATMMLVSARLVSLLSHWIIQSHYIHDIEVSVVQSRGATSWLGHILCLKLHSFFLSLITYIASTTCHVWSWLLLCNIQLGCVKVADIATRSTPFWPHSISPRTPDRAVGTRTEAEQ
jgi:hypothetical protein